MLFLDYNLELINEGDETWDELEDGEIINLSNIRSKRDCCSSPGDCGPDYG